VIAFRRRYRCSGFERRAETRMPLRPGMIRQQIRKLPAA
jgi:hypothetical protein